MQSLGAVTYADLAAPAQATLWRLELWDGASWIDLTALDSKNYVKSLSLQLGGAGVSPEPVAGQWSAEIFNENGIFHPRHPTSLYSAYFRVGRKVRISFGATYGVTDYYWQRLIGYMDAPKFDAGAGTLSVSGFDYSKALTDTILRSPSNYWGSSATFSTVATSSSLGSEIYDEADVLEIGAHEANNITNWTDDAACTAAAATDAGGGSTYVMRITKDTNSAGYTTNTNVGAVTAGVEYECSFKYEMTPAEGGGSVQAMMYVGAALDGYSAAGESETWGSASFRFTASSSANMTLKFKVLGDAGTVADVDQVSIKPVTTPGINTTYILPDASTGAYYATLGGLPIYRDDPPEKFGWGNVEGSNLFYFVNGAIITGGTNNLVVYYYTEQAPENVVADLMAAGPGDAGGGAGLYANRAAALAAMTYTATGITVDKVWFDVGTPAMGAIRLLCERANYRFWFSAAGVPTFQPAPTLGDPILGFEAKDASEISSFADLGEIRNSVALEGIERTETSPVGKVEKSRWKGVASDSTSIATYLEHTYTATNNLFQDQDSITAAAQAILAAFKDPKWYATMDVPHNPAPLDLGDTVGFKLPLAPASGTTAALEVETRGIIRDISLSDSGFSYKVEMESGLMNVANYTQAASPVTVSAEHCKGWVLTNYGATAGVHYDLPAAAVGMRIYFYVEAAYAMTVDPNGTDQIMVLTGTAGDYLASDAVIGSNLTLVCLVANKWHCLDKTGTWTEE